MGLAAHDDRMTHSKRFESFEVRGQMPWQLSVLSNDAITRHCHDQYKLRSIVRCQRVVPGYTAIGALIAG